MKMNKTIQNEINKIPNEIIEKYNISIDEDGLILEFEDKRGYIHVKFDRFFKITIDEICIDIKNKKMVMSLWKKNYIWQLTVY